MEREHTSEADIRRLLVSGADDGAVLDAFDRLLTSLNGPTQAVNRFCVAGFICAHRPHLAEHALRYPIELLHSQCQLDNPEWFPHAADWVEGESWRVECAGPDGLKWLREELPKLAPLLERLLWDGAVQGRLLDFEKHPAMTEEVWLGCENACRMMRYLWRQKLPLPSRQHTLVAAELIRLSERLFRNAESYRYVTQLFDAKLDTGVDQLPGNRPEEVAASLWAMHEDLTDDESRALADSIRDIFGNPFCPAALDRVWLTTDVIALARGIYAERAFDRMPILADALQDAGCDNAEVLDHCRGPGPHVRGCWVVDLLLGL